MEDLHRNGQKKHSEVGKLVQPSNYPQKRLFILDKYGLKKLG